jgi:uncharacterized protein (TIGR00369 family)
MEDRSSVERAKPVLYPELDKKVREIPIFSLLPFELVEAGEGSASLTLPYKHEYDGIFDSLHGGFLMTLSDTAACIAVLTKTGPDTVVTTTDMNIRFLAACRSKATAQAKIIKFGRSLVPVHVDIFDEQGTLVAVSQVTYMRLRG